MAAVILFQERLQSCQSVHRGTKRAILAKLEQEDLITAPFDETLARCRNLIDGKGIDGQIAFLTSDLVRNYLTALEHHRWNTFYYAHGFTWAPKQTKSGANMIV